MPAEPGKAAKGRGKRLLPPEGLWGRTQPPARPLNQTLRLHHLPATACDVRGPVPGPGLRSRKGRCCETKGETRLRRRVSFSGRPHFHLCPPRPSHTQSTGCSKLHLPGEVRGLPGGGPGPLSIPAAAGSLVARGTRPTTASWKEALLPQVRGRVNGCPSPLLNPDKMKDHARAGSAGRSPRPSLGPHPGPFQVCRAQACAPVNLHGDRCHTAGFRGPSLPQGLFLLFFLPCYVVFPHLPPLLPQVLMVSAQENNRIS